MTLYLYVPNEGDAFYSPILLPNKGLGWCRVFSLSEDCVAERCRDDQWSPCGYCVDNDSLRSVLKRIAKCYT